MRTWQAAAARHKFGDVIHAAVRGEPQFIERRDGKKVVLVSKGSLRGYKTKYQDISAEPGLFR